MCNDCFEKHILSISADMDEGFAGFKRDRMLNDQLITCEICGMEIASEKKDAHLYSEHGISI